MTLYYPLPRPQSPGGKKERKGENTHTQTHIQETEVGGGGGGAAREKIMYMIAASFSIVEDWNPRVTFLFGFVVVAVVRAFVRACVCACVRACVRVCVCVCVTLSVGCSTEDLAVTPRTWHENGYGTLRASLSGTFIGGVVNQCLSLGIRLDRKCDLGRDETDEGRGWGAQQLMKGLSTACHGEGHSATCELNEFHSEKLEVANQDLAYKGIN